MARHVTSLKEQIDDLNRRVACLESKSTQHQDVAAESSKSRPHSETESVLPPASMNGALDEALFDQFEVCSKQMESMLGLRLVNDTAEQNWRDSHVASSFPLSNVTGIGRGGRPPGELHRSTTIDGGILASLQQTCIPDFSFPINPNGRAQPFPENQSITLEDNTGSWGMPTGVTNWTPLSVDHGHPQQGSAVFQPSWATSQQLRDMWMQSPEDLAS